ncbi:ribosome small subunit-dependent GTPase A [Laribacter hongkongensis]|uniref:ribosome small subunit-dependent GTPase A n=1 Tax=Laribacter hongkongensis TaxID=168471 RepID=UPI001EFD423C|nr:ribosome small subunit-dependent GTPase A [Laribacter hongkongensis]MCG9082081.1 ribosome small subunit-dependent GTPase A [Laribacter hongkongensis]
MTQSSGQIIKSHGRRYVVEASDGRRYDCTTRGKRTDYACGDRVDLLIHNDEQAVIERAQPRRSLLYRQDDFRQKLIAANVTQLVVVLAAVPTPAPEFLDRCLIAAEASDIATLIVLNKCDLPQTAGLHTSLGFYREIGYDVLELSALGDISALRARLAGHTSVLIGQSGMGKSTLTNALVPEARARTNDISEALDTGKHTTTHAELYHLDAHSDLIDSPGLQEFGLSHLEATGLAHCFPEMRPLLGHCRFHNCAHLVEPGCALLAAHAAHETAGQRLPLLQKLTRQLKR